MHRLPLRHAVVSGLIGIVSLAALHGSAWAARAEIVDMDEKDTATLKKETLKQRREGGSSSTGAGSSNKGCGNVDIGNDSDKKGSSRIGDHQKTVIVNGPVYNTANCKK